MQGDEFALLIDLYVDSVAGVQAPEGFAIGATIQQGNKLAGFNAGLIEKVGEVAAFLNHKCEFLKACISFV